MKKQKQIDICTLYGYGWERQLTPHDLALLCLKIGQARGLSDTQRSAARHVLGIEVNPKYGKWHAKIGRATLRENTSPTMCGIERSKLVLLGDPPWRSREVAGMLGLSPSKLRELIKRARNGKLVGLPEPGRNIGRAQSEIGWYVWSVSVVMAWHKAMIDGRFDWRSRTQRGGESTNE